ncbi:hypothetical protein [Lysinibacillus sp. GbtcB16]|uniref:hypothetical protein n=1 Tax=Lysinibacillus sp. GbtcB16 TaxID=2824761 RepID=UPI001C30892C|nr:hypothetical protein [Lysinibacillus sp. GbtcB16]
MFEGMTEEEKALFKEFLDKKREEENQMTTNTNVANTQTKGDRFLKSASRRQRKALESLDLVSNLSVTSRYTYDREQAENLIESLEERVACIKVLFERGVARQEKKADEKE